MLIDDPRPTEPPIPVTREEEYLTDFSKRIHANNVAKGFWPEVDKESRNFGELLALIHAEITETYDAATSPCRDEKLPLYTAFEVELADVLIRLLDAHAVFGPERVGKYFLNFPETCQFASVEEHLMSIHRIVSQTLEAHRKSKKHHDNSPMYGVLLDRAIQRVLLISELYVDRRLHTITDVAEEKVAFNTTRPYKHDSKY